MNEVLVFSGSAGSGKGTVLKCIREKDPRFRLSVSMTTRSPRPGEQNGREYYFVSREEFLETLAQDGFLEHTEYCGNLYGTPKKQFFDMIENGFIPVLEIETDGAEQVMQKLSSYTSVFLSPPDYKTLEARLRGRATEKEEEIRSRLRAAREEIFRSERYQYVVLNADGAAEKAADAILEIMKTGKSESDAVVCDRAKFLASFSL